MRSQVPVASLVAPAAVLGAALGFGAQRIVQDLLAGFFIITEKQYGFGDLVEADDRCGQRGGGHGRGRHAAASPSCGHPRARCSPCPTARSSRR